jgi:hypothetical protein
MKSFSHLYIVVRFGSLSGAINACHYSEILLLWNELLLWFEVLMLMLTKGKVF